MESSYDAAVAAGGAFTYLLVAALSIVYIIAYWRLFEKAGEPGWMSLIPFVNTFIMFKIIYGNGWKMFLMFVPILDVILSFAMIFRLAQVYGKGTGFALGLLFLSPIFFLMLAFGDSQYYGAVDSFM